MQPTVPAQDLDSDEVRTRVVLNYLRQCLRAEDIHIETIDYDLAVASFLQETAHLTLGPIPKSVDRVLSDFALLEPLTPSQEQLRTCASHIRDTIDNYLKSPRSATLPFALRYRTLPALKAMASRRAACPRPLPSGVAVLLRDEGGRMLALGIPPKTYKVEPLFLSGEVSKVPRWKV